MSHAERASTPLSQIAYGGWSPVQARHVRAAPTLAALACAVPATAPSPDAAATAPTMKPAAFERLIATSRRDITTRSGREEKIKSVVRTDRCAACPGKRQ
jgi:hypothetical protein